MSFYEDKEMILDVITFCLSFFLAFLGQLLIAIILFYFFSIFVAILILNKLLKLLARIFLLIIPLPRGWRFALQRRIVGLKNKLVNIDLVATGLVAILIFVIFIGFSLHGLAKPDLPDFQNWTPIKVQIVDINKDKIEDLGIISLLNPKNHLTGQLIFDLKTNHTVFIWRERYKIHVAIKKPNSKKWIIDNESYLKEFLDQFNQSLNFNQIPNLNENKFKKWL